MKLGELVICRDFNQVGWFFQNHPTEKTRVITLDDEIINAEGYIQGSMLLPPPSALFTLIDNNDINSFQAMYYSYLHLPDIDSFIMLIITALFREVNIIFFLNTSDPSMFMDYLNNFLSTIYGVIPTPFEMICGPHSPSIIPNALAGLLSKMVQYQYITQEEYAGYFVQCEASPFQKFSI